MVANHSVKFDNEEILTKTERILEDLRERTRSVDRCTLADNREVGKELRVVVVDALKETMKNNEQVIALDADLGGASKWTDLIKTNPDRFINVGIAEANMVGVAAGLN